MIFQCMDGTSIEDWLELFTGTVGRKVSSSLKQRKGQLILRIRVINQKEIGMLSSEWQTLSLSQPMQKCFIQVLAHILPNNLIHFWQPMLLLRILTDKWFYLANTRFCQTLHSYIRVVITDCLRPRPKGAPTVFIQSYLDISTVRGLLQ